MQGRFRSKTRAVAETSASHRQPLEAAADLTCLVGRLSGSETGRSKTLLDPVLSNGPGSTEPMRSQLGAYLTAERRTRRPQQGEAMRPGDTLARRAGASRWAVATRRSSRCRCA